jgi:hypothetical protein
MYNFEIIVKKNLYNLMLNLFRHKMVSIVKYFQRNDFLEKIIFLKIFLVFGSYEKITNGEKSPVMRFYY